LAGAATKVLRHRPVEKTRMVSLRVHLLAWTAAGLTGLAAQSGTAFAQGVQAAVTLAPHRAVYEITLDQSKARTSVSDMTGRMVYELSGSACEGYSQSMRFVTRVVNQEGSATITDLRSTSWEDALAKAFRFTSNQLRDSKVSETTQGEANRASSDAPGKIVLTKPAAKEIAIKRATYFPIQHSMALIEAARKGVTVFTADLYDGSEKGEKVYNTTAYIGKAKPTGHNKTLATVAQASRLDAIKSWPVSISYYDDATGKTDAVPSYELAFLYFENGVSRKLFIDYGDFAIRGTLSQITFLEPGKCNASVKR